MLLQRPERAASAPLGRTFCFSQPNRLVEIYTGPLAQHKKSGGLPRSHRFLQFNNPAYAEIRSLSGTLASLRVAVPRSLRVMRE
jgi:hypothetical protein